MNTIAMITVGQAPRDDLVPDMEAVFSRKVTIWQVRARLAAGARIARLDRGLMALSRILNPVLYTVDGPHDHDPALQAPMLPGLQAVGRLAGLAPDSDEYGFLRTRLVRDATGWPMRWKAPRSTSRFS